MQKFFVSILMALVLALALVGVKRMFQGTAPATHHSVVAEVAAPAPDIPW